METLMTIINLNWPWISVFLILVTFYAICHVLGSIFKGNKWKP
jgi:hypothetical protein